MKGRVIAIAPHGVALMVDGRLEDLILDAPGGLPSAGDICVVRVTRKLPKVGAFCEMPGGGEGYLRDAKAVKNGQRILVQVVSLPEPGKAVTLTTRVLYKGPRLILTPGAPGVNVSRKIGNEAERERLEAVVRAAQESRACAAEADAFGVIIRTSARGEDDARLAQEFERLASQMDDCNSTLNTQKGPHPGLRVMPLDYALREWLFPTPDAILCAGVHDDGVAERLYGDDRILSLTQLEADPFETAGVNDAIEALKSQNVSLGSGASIAIEPTRALVAIDVNTGADFSPAAGLKTNLAAANDLPRQLRLRGLGGQIAVDFAPMPKQHRRTLEEALKRAFRSDPVETNLVGWTTLGLYELQRKRERRPLTEVLGP